MKLNETPNDIQSKIIELESEIVAILEPPFKLSELFGILETVGSIYGGIDGITKSEVHELLNETWDLFNTKYAIVQKLDDLIKLPSILESFDSMLIDLLVKKVLFPSIVNLLKIPD